MSKDKKLLKEGLDILGITLIHMLPNSSIHPLKVLYFTLLLCFILSFNIHKKM